MRGMRYLIIEEGGKCPKSGIFRKKVHTSMYQNGYGYRCIYCGKTLYNLRREEDK